MLSAIEHSKHTYQILYYSLHTLKVIQETKKGAELFVLSVHAFNKKKLSGTQNCR